MQINDKNDGGVVFIYQHNTHTHLSAFKVNQIN